MANLLNNLINYVFSNEAEKLKENKPLSYVAASNGMFQIRRSAVMDTVTKANDIKGLPAMTPGISIKVPKVPLTFFNQMVSFFKKIYETDTTEASLMLFYNKERNEFIPWAPLQVNAGAASNYKRDDDPEYTQMCKDNTLVMVNHSHPWSGSPSPSSIDNGDEKESLLYMIIGNVKNTPTFYLSTCPGGIRTQLNFFDVFEKPDIGTKYPILDALIEKHIKAEDLIPIFYEPDVEFPQEWLTRCSKRATVTTTRTGGSYNYNYSQMGLNDWYDSSAYYGQNGIYSQGSLYQSYLKDEIDESEIDEYEAAFNKRNKAINQKSKVFSSDIKSPKHIEDKDFDADPMIEEVSQWLEYMTDVEVAQVIIELINDGRGSLLHKCLEMQQSGELETVSAKGSTSPGVTLIKQPKTTPKKSKAKKGK